MKKPTTPRAHAAALAAMVEIERAQGCIDRACQLLSPIRGGLLTYEATGREYQRIRQLWDRVRKLSQREGLSLDSEDP